MTTNKDLLAKRGYIKGSVTRIITFLEKNDKENVGAGELISRLEKLENKWSEYENVYLQLISLDENNTPELKDELNKELEDFENSFYSARSRLTELVSNIASSSSSPSLSSYNTAHCVNPSTNHPAVKLPVINLPTFSGAYESWFSFHDTFVSLIETNRSLSQVQKFYYLKSCLKDEAEKLLQSIDVTNDNYAVAWKLLKDRFEDKQLIISKTVESLINPGYVKQESAAGLRHLLDSTVKHLRVLAQLGEPTTHWDTIIVHIVVSRVDSTTRREWESRADITYPVKFETLSKFLQTRCKMLESVESHCQLQPSSSTYQQSTKASRQSSTKLFTAAASCGTNSTESDTQESSNFTKSPQSCKICKQSHFTQNCEILLKMNVEERISEVRKRNLCINCLRYGHFVVDCKSSKCRKCNQTHHTILHIEKTNRISEVSSQQGRSEEDPGLAPQETINNLCAHSVNTTQVFLATAIVKVQDKFGSYYTCRALLDSASQSNFMSEQLCQILQLERKETSMPVYLLEDSCTNVTQSVNTTIKSRLNEYSANLEFSILSKITGKLPCIHVNTTDWNIPKNIKLADPNFNVPNKIDMLIGAKLFFKIFSVGEIEMSPNLPTFKKTVFGWVLGGEASQQSAPLPSNENKVYACHVYSSPILNDQITKFWTIEDCSKKQHMTKEEIECEEFFKENYSRDTSGRFTVKLPIKENLQDLGSSKEVALKRFCLLENKFKRQPVLHQSYSEFIEEYKQLHHMKLVENNINNQRQSYYIPHHAVFKPSSSTTKLRVVFDASCKTTTGRSLNDMMMVGPNLQDDLFSIIARFRTHKFIMIADIQKMYRQINIDPSQLHLQQIFWRNNLTDDIDTYQLNTVTYGTSSAPYLAVKCLQQLATEEKEEFEVAADVILNDFYVDDMMTGTNTIEEGLKVQQEVVNLLKRGGFSLHKWCSNSVELLKNIPEHLQETSNNLTVDSDDTIKTLGLTYHPRADIFSFNIALNNSTQQVTKRIILSDISKIFDPLGLVGPIITKAKIIIQELWKLKLDWDESIPCSMFSNWLKFKEQLQNLNSIKIQRMVANVDDISHIELHGFCDASEVAFGASIYLRTVCSDGSSANLLCSKSRVAPIKFTTIARLELCAAQLLVQLFEKVNSSIKIPILKNFFWTDSTIVLHWLRAPAAHWKTYVANRVAEIQQITNIDDWRHVRTHENPADLISRGVTSDQLINSSLWWHGPQFLSDSRTDFDEKGALEILSFDEAEKLKEEQKPLAVTVLHSTVTSDAISEFDLLEKFSSFERLQRITGYVLRFIRRTQKISDENNTIQLSVKELHQATERLVKLSQAIDFQDEIKELQRNKQVSAKSKILSLTPFLDINGIVRVGGRLQHSNLSDDQKHPMIISSSSNLTKLIINFYHIKNLHAGPRALLASVRQQFWPLKGKNLATKCVHQCVRCFRSKPVMRHQIMGDLPKHRVEPLRAFVNTGIDFCGPIQVRRGVRGQSHVKAYIAVFVCFATKAVHLELVGDLTTDSFLAALKRFISRRGRCANIYSDNATNFTGANRELGELQELFASEQHNNKVYSTLANEQIKWHFIPPRSPHFGGLWEAAVKSAKHHLKRILDSTFLTYEEYTTILAQVEAVLNSRPLTSLSNDPNDLSVLTPGHFLIGDSMTCIPEPDYTPLMINRLSRWQRVQQIQQQFWQRWKSEYLTELQQRSKWKKKEPEITIGSLVLLKDDNLPPLKWALGRVICLHPGKDNVNRVVTLKTSTGTMKRAIAKVCLLPVEDTP